MKNMKVVSLLLVLCIFAGCTPDEVTIDHLVREIEELGGGVIRDESDKVIYINLASCQIGDKLIHQLPAFEHLQYLHLEDSDIVNEDLQAIGQIASLEVLNINTTNTTDEGLFFLMPINNLKRLEMNHYSWTRPLPEELKNINIEDVLSGKVEYPKIERDYGDGIRALVEKFPDLQPTLWGAMTWPGAAQDD